MPKAIQTELSGKIRLETSYITSDSSRFKEREEAELHQMCCDVEDQCERESEEFADDSSVVNFMKWAISSGIIKVEHVKTFLRNYQEKKRKPKSDPTRKPQLD